MGRIPVCSVRVTCDGPEGQLDPFQLEVKVRYKITPFIGVTMTVIPRVGEKFFVTKKNGVQHR